MKLAIKDIGPIIDLALDLDKKVTLLTGLNGAGKTSTAQAIIAGITGKHLPDGWKKEGAKDLVRNGATAGSVRIVGDDGTSRFISYPDGKAAEPEGKAPWASDFASGRRQIVKLDIKERTQELVRILKANPTLADLCAAMNAKGMSKEDAKQLWELIEAKGWNDAFEDKKEEGTVLKGQWKGIAKSGDWGTQKGPGGKNEWKPDAWIDELAGFSEEKLVKGVEKAKKDLEAAIAANAVSAAERAKLTELAGKKDELLAELDRFRKAEVTAQDEWKKARAELEAFKVPTEIEPTEPCPHCEKPLVIRKGKPCKPDESKPSSEDLQKALAQKKELVAAIDLKMAEWDAIKNDAAKANHAATEATRAAERLKELSAGNLDESAVANARKKSELSAAYLAAWKQKTEADAIDKKIHQNLDVQTILSPDGLRMQKLSSALDGFNKTLAALSQTAGWSTVEMGVYGAMLGGENYRKLSGGEKFRVESVVQMAIATIEKADLVVFDIDTLIDAGARTGFFKLAGSLGIPVVVAMMFDKDKAPDLATAQLGTTHWLERGALKEKVAV